MIKSFAMYRCSVELSVRYDELSQSECEHASLIDEYTRLISSDMVAIFVQVRYLNTVLQVCPIFTPGNCDQEVVFSPFAFRSIKRDQALTKSMYSYASTFRGSILYDPCCLCSGHFNNRE